jgi:hypothetical protein
MRRLAVLGVLTGAILAGRPKDVAAQEGSQFLPAGQAAPEIELVGATRYGVLAEPVHLSDFRGETVVLAFFFRARTPG